MLHNDYWNDKKILSLGWWYVDETFSPKNIILSNFSSAIEKYWYWILQYESSYWLLNLRNAIKAWAPDFFNIPKFDLDNLVITNWITNALDMVGRIILQNKYDSFIIEPCYDTAIESLRRNSKNIYSKKISWQNWYLNITEKDFLEIEKTFLENSIKLFYIIPNYSNPSGLTIKCEDKIRLWTLCQKYSITIFEDDPYAVYWYSNVKIPSFFEMFKDITLYANSFSKIWFPWLRIWFLLWNKDIILEYANFQKYAYSSPNLITQGIVESLINTHSIDQIFMERFVIMKEKYSIISEFLSQNFPWKYQIFWGWFYVWYNIEDNLNFINNARKNQIIVIPGGIYWKNYDFGSYIRIAFSHISIEDLKIALEKIKNII